MKTNPKHVYIKSVSFERNTQTGLMEVIVESNHGYFALRDDVLNPEIVNQVYDYIKEKATEVIQRYIADQVQQELEKTSEERAKEVLGINEDNQ